MDSSINFFNPGLRKRYRAVGGQGDKERKAVTVHIYTDLNTNEDLNTDNDTKADRDTNTKKRIQMEPQIQTDISSYRQR